MRSLSIAATRMLAQQLNVEVISNNIANLATTGFKRQRPEFQDLLYQSEREVGSTSSGTVGDIPVMRSPTPGESIMLAIDDAFALANANGLGWRPVAPFTHTAITRAWRSIERAEIVAALEPALAAYGSGHNLTIDIPRSASTVKIARGAIAELAIQDLAYDPATGRFRATLVIRDSFGKARRDALFGSAISYIELPVLRARLRRDHVISDTDVVWQSSRANRVPADALDDPAAMIGL
ncbi:MAG: flagellar basal body protein, partial [Alphaproteobacteria bacterium]